MQQHVGNRAEALERIKALVDRMKVGMLTTIDAEGELRSRPLQTRDFDESGALWFFTSRSSPKVDEMAAEGWRVCVSYADPDEQDYLSISGTAMLVDDRQRMADLWTDWVKVWFPQGLEDPDLVLLRVAVDKAEYWDSPGSGLARMFALGKALATGDKDSIGDNEKIDLRR